MPTHEIVLKPSAVKDLDRRRKFDAALIAEGIERFLRDDPTQVSKSRIKRLKGISNPDFRLRLDDYRVFYTVDAKTGQVDVLRILHKDETAEYYKEITP